MFDNLSDWQKIGIATLVAAPVSFYAVVQGAHPVWAVIAGAEVVFLVLCLFIIKEHRGYVFRAIAPPNSE